MRDNLVPVAQLVLRGGARRAQLMLFNGYWPMGDRLPVKRNVSADGITQDGHMDLAMITREGWEACRRGEAPLVVTPSFPGESRGPWYYGTPDEFFDDGWRGD